MRIASRPRRGDALGTDSKGGLITLAEIWQRFFDELATRASKATAADGDQTPSVRGLGQRGLLKLSNTAPTNVSFLDDGQDLQEVVLHCTNGNTTLVHSASFRLSGGGNVTPAANSSLVMKLDDDVWHQVGAVVTT